MKEFRAQKSNNPEAILHMYLQEMLEGVRARLKNSGSDEDASDKRIFRRS